MPHYLYKFLVILCCYMVCMNAVMSFTYVPQLILLSNELADYLETSETEGTLGFQINNCGRV
jgi:hypothetical protein